MRVTESRLMDLSASGVTDAREKLARAQEVMSTGISVKAPSEGGAAWAAGARATAIGKLASSQGRALGRARDNLGLADEALGSIGDSLSRLRETTIQAANGTLTAQDRAGLVELVRTMGQGATNVANTRGADGEYLFAGTKGDAAAFDATAVYQGDTLVRNIDLGNGQKIGPARPVMINGAPLQNALPLFERVALALESNDIAGLRSALTDIETAINGVATTRTTVGARMEALDVADASRESFELQLADTHARAVEADPIVAASNLARSAGALERARASAEAVLSVIRSR